jgi:diaminohydroxyphosphoribosylaminopyrimidine deaminase/5-amino-6-(5-phosphoribosylamino)uracil reductase
MATLDDEIWMRRAIELARSRVGLTGDNPAVGCVIVKDGVVVGEAATAPGGRLHAEERALDHAGEAARGATAYITLEPCGERSSGAASCGERLARAGVARAVVAREDPSVLAAGRGLHRLSEAGIVTDLGLLSGEAAALYAAYQPRGVR